MVKVVVNFLFKLLVFIIIIDPADLLFHLKTPVFLAVVFVWLISKLWSKIYVVNDVYFLILVFLIIPLISIASGLIQNNLTDIGFAIGFFKSAIFIGLLIIIYDMNIPIQKYLIRYSILISVITISIYLIFLNKPQLFGAIYRFVLDKNIAIFSIRNYYGLTVFMLFYKTAPLLVFALAHYCQKFINDKNRMTSLVLAFVFLFTLLLSGTRANIVTASCLFIYFVLKYYYRKPNKIGFSVTILIIVCSLFLFIQSLSFGQQDKSSEIKSGHFNSYIKLFNENPQYLIWGEGLGSKFYSTGLNSLISQTELTYLDLIRFFGIPLFLLFLFIIIYPAIYLYVSKKINAENEHAVVAYFGYLFIAGTNPLLISSTGMLVILVMYSLIKKQTKYDEGICLPC
ncbi:O-antigen polymerase [Mucilaginibacter antarcticus]|uniref:O-antigen polymerase n=1 Tax=Mucilaginibacter antarcticus TaxID=1855725 RepID=A0ABW5XNB2_9SPHI